VTLGGTTYHDDAPADVVKILELVRQNGTRVRVLYGKDGIPWGDGFTGRIGRSCGDTKIPIVLRNAKSAGGEAILDNRIVYIACANKRYGGVLYDARKGSEFEPQYQTGGAP